MNVLEGPYVRPEIRIPEIGKMPLLRSCGVPHPDTSRFCFFRLKIEYPIDLIFLLRTFYFHGELMSVEVVMPQMGESITEGTVSKWLKKVGDKIEKDEPILEISTDKVDAEVPSPGAGILLEIRHAGRRNRRGRNRRRRHRRGRRGTCESAEQSAVSGQPAAPVATASAAGHETDSRRDGSAANCRSGNQQLADLNPNSQTRTSRS